MRWNIAFHFGVFAVELFPGAGLQFGDNVLEADGKVLAGEGAFRERSAPSRSNLAFTPVSTPLKTPANPEASRRACQFSNRLRVRLTRRGQAKESCYIAVLRTAPKTGSFTHSPKSAVFSIQRVK